MDQTVELYSGAEKPFSKIAEALGYAATSVDPNREAGATVTGSIVEDLAARLPRAPLIVWAAPPFSEVLSTKAEWENDGSFYPKTADAQLAIDQLRNTIGLLHALKPTWWFIEQPKSLVRNMPLLAGFNRGYPSRNRRTMRYDEFGGNAETESDVWTNAYWWIPRPGERDATSGVQSGSRVPPFAIAQMFEQLEHYRQTGSYGPKV